MDYQTKLRMIMKQDNQQQNQIISGKDKARLLKAMKEKDKYDKS